MNVTIKLVNKNEQEVIKGAATVLTKAFHIMSPTSWTTIEEGLEEVHDLLDNENFVMVALADDRVVGLIGGIPGYDGNVFELHPLAVLPDWQSKGIGRQLVAAFEDEVVKRGGITITLGTDDQTAMTSLTGVDLYKGTWDKVANIRNHKQHPFEFYQKQGYQIIGVVPDANGYGRPDIIMGKRVGTTPKSDTNTPTQ